MGEIDSLPTTSHPPRRTHYVTAHYVIVHHLFMSRTNKGNYEDSMAL